MSLGVEVAIVGGWTIGSVKDLSVAIGKDKW